MKKINLIGLLLLANYSSAIACDFKWKIKDSHPGLQQMIDEKIQQKIEKDAHKYTKIISISGEHSLELDSLKKEAESAYIAWFEFKSTLSKKNNPSHDDYQQIDFLSKYYSKTRKSFMDLQHKILAANNIQFKDHSDYLVLLN
jgi:hypothetical protein